MEESIVRKKRELVLFLLTVIALAFLVSTFSNLIFSSFYSGNKYIFTLACSVAFVILTIFALWFLLNERFKSKVDVCFIYAFSRKRKAFLDIRNCPASVNARLLFEDLPTNLKNHYSELDQLDKFFLSDFDEYINHVTQAIIMMRILRQRLSDDFRNSERVDYEKLPLSMRNNKSIKYYFQDEDLFLPCGAKIETFGHNEYYIRIKSKYGKLEFSWNVGYCQAPYHSEAYLSITGLTAKTDYHDFIVDINFTADHNFANIISNDLKNYLKFIECVKRDLAEFDWKRTERMLPIELLKILINTKNSTAS